MSYDETIKPETEFDAAILNKVLEEVAYEDRQKGSKSPDRSARRKVLKKKPFQLGSYKR